MADVDTTRLEKKLRKLGKAGDRAIERASRDAGKQLGTQVKREISKELNLYSSEIGNRLHVDAHKGEMIFRVKYKRINAHKFKGARYRRTHGSGFRTEHIGKKTVLSKSVKNFGDTAGLVVKFTRGRPAVQFSRAFRTERLGQGRVFFQSKRKDAGPIIAIAGPTPHGIAEESVKKYANVAKSVYIRRLKYWGEKEIARDPR